MTVRKNWGQRKRVPVTLPADLEAELKKVREVAPPPPTEEPIYKYLKRVYELRQKLEDSDEWKDAVDKYHKAHRLRIEKNYVRFIIQQTTGDHVTYQRTNNYKFTLQVALREGIKPADVADFFKKQGSIKKCVALWKSKYGSPRKKTEKEKSLKSRR